MREMVHLVRLFVLTVSHDGLTMELHVAADLLRSRGHQERLANFKKEFEVAKDQFDRNVQVESMRMLFTLCMSFSSLELMQLTSPL